MCAQQGIFTLLVYKHAIAELLIFLHCSLCFKNTTLQQTMQAKKEQRRLGNIVNHLLSNKFTSLHHSLAAKANNTNHQQQANHQTQQQFPITFEPSVLEALEQGHPVVALESTIISHGMPYPQNVLYILFYFCLG